MSLTFQTKDEAKAFVLEARKNGQLTSVNLNLGLEKMTAAINKHYKPVAKPVEVIPEPVVVIPEPEVIPEPVFVPISPERAYIQVISIPEPEVESEPVVELFVTPEQSSDESSDESFDDLLDELFEEVKPVNITVSQAAKDYEIERIKKYVSTLSDQEKQEHKKLSESELDAKVDRFEYLEDLKVHNNKFITFGADLLFLNDKDKKECKGLPKGWADFTSSCSQGKNVMCVQTGSRSKITVIDFDNSESYFKLVAMYPDWKKYCTVKTLKGYHIYFTYREEIKNSTDIFIDFPGVDVRNDGGFVYAL